MHPPNIHMFRQSVGDLREVPVLPLEELRAHGELVLLLALRLPRPLRRQVVLDAALPVLVVLQRNDFFM